MSQVHDMFVRLYRIRKTVLEMLHDRDYLVSEQERSRTKEEFRVGSFALLLAAFAVDVD